MLSAFFLMQCFSIQFAWVGLNAFLFQLFECRFGDFGGFLWFDEDVAFALVACVLFPARCLVERWVMLQ